jgi:hypothetical protein
MRLEVRSTIEAPVEEIASQARRIPDRVRRLRYLRESVVLAPTRIWWLPSPKAAAIGLMALIGMAILIWIVT